MSPTSSSSAAPLRVALDNSALGNVLVDEESVRRFAVHVQGRGFHTFVSDVVLDELFADPNAAKVLGRLKNLRSLCRLLEPSLWRIPDHHSFMSAEGRGRRDVWRAYYRDWGFVTAVPDSALEEHARLTESHAARVRQTKQEFFDLDRDLARWTATERNIQVTPSEIAKQIECAGFPREDDMMIEHAFGLSGHRYTAAQIAARPRRFRAIHATSHLVWRLCLANVADRDSTSSTDEQVIGRWRTKAKGGKGAWYDAFIAGSAAYMDVFVTDDADLLWRCERLRERGLLGFRSVPLNEFTGGAQTA